MRDGTGDDWECYRPAQLALIHTLARHMAKSRGCYVIVTGDYHISDIKVPADLAPGRDYCQ